MLKLFVIYHDAEMLNQVRDEPFIHKYHLDVLDIGKYQIPALAENRFLYFLSSNPQLIDQEYVGVASASWDLKYKFGMRHETPLVNSLCRLSNLYIDEVLAADTTESCNWYEKSELYHPGITKLIDELYERNQFKCYGLSFWANNFVCHRAVMFQFLKWWRIEFEYFFEKYGVQMPYFHNWVTKDWLHPAYFFERLTVAYFCNRYDLKITQLEHSMVNTRLF